MLTEYKTKKFHFFEDAQGRIQGEAKLWWDNGQLREHCFYVDDACHGEAKYWNEDGTLLSHTFWVNGKVYRSNLIKEPVDDKDKFLITIETGGKWLC